MSSKAAEIINIFTVRRVEMIGIRTTDSTISEEYLPPSTGRRVLTALAQRFGEAL